MQAVYILIIFFSLGLTSCVYYGDLQNHAKPLTDAEITARASYQRTLTSSSFEWWSTFNDSQLNQLIDTALQSSPDMKIAEARLRKAQYVKAGFVSNLFPSVGFTGSFQRERFSEYGLIPPPFNGQIFNIAQLGLNLDYDFDFWGKNRNRLAARISEECAALADLSQAKLMLSSAIATTYFELLGVMAERELAEEKWHISEAISKIAQHRAAHQIVSPLPVNTAMSSIHSAKLIVARYQQLEMILRHQLAQLLGNHPWTANLTTHPFRFYSFPITLPKYLSINLLGARPDIIATKARAAAAASQIKVAKAYFFPDINLSAIYSYQSIEMNKLFNPASQNNAMIGAIDLPIFDAGRRRANLGVQYAEYDIAVHEYNQTILKALKEIADGVSNLRTLHTQLVAQNKRVNSIKNNVRVYTARYKHGIVAEDQVLQIKQVLLEQQSDKINLQTRYLQTIVAMLKALGGHHLGTDDYDGTNNHY